VERAIPPTALANNAMMLTRPTDVPQPRVGRSRFMTTVGSGRGSIGI
jgi:hypothetical protein